MGAINLIPSIFERHFPDFCAEYNDKYVATCRKYRSERIEQLGARFTACRDYLQAVARICCINPECGYDYFRPFSCKRFYLCRSCRCKRTIPFAEHLTSDVLRRLRHHHFVFTKRKALLPFFRHDQRLLADLPRLIRLSPRSAAPRRRPSRIPTNVCFYAYSTQDRLFRVL